MNAVANMQQKCKMRVSGYDPDARDKEKNDMTLLALLALSIFLIALRPIGRIKM